MTEFIVAIDHITYYAVQAKDEVTAIDLVLEDQGLEISGSVPDLLTWVLDRKCEFIAVHEESKDNIMHYD
jgi:hypothetical protein